jgi:type 1 glutamine amidotransferase
MYMAGLAVCMVGAGQATAEDAKTKILFVAGHPSHPPGEHEHRAGCMLLAKALEEGLPNVDAEVMWYGWPEDTKVFDGVASVVMYCDGANGHYVNDRLDFVQGLADKGVGLACLHFAVEVPKGPTGDRFLQWIGGYFEVDWSVNPTWTASFTNLLNHPITQGVSAFSIHDEWYYHMRFPEGMKGVMPILSAVPPKETLSRTDGSRSGNPAVRAEVDAGKPQIVAWAIERPDGGRGFGFTGGHFHRNWQDDSFRKLVLNAIAWTAKVDVPVGGVASTTPSDEEMRANLDEKRGR